MLANKIHHIDCLAGLAQIPAKSIRTSVSSPPYYGLRDYKLTPTSWPEVKYKLFGFEIVIPAGECCLGLEETPEAFIGHMILIYRGVHRALTDDGTAWINMGDTYFGGKGANGASRTGMDGHEPINVDALVSTKPGEFRPQDRPHPEMKAKDMMGIPWMLAFALRADGWILRQDIIWSKPNPMPESTTDRCTKSHEYIFLLSKNRKYYYDSYSISTPYKEKTYTTFGITPKGNGDGSGLIASENWASRISERKPKDWKMPDGWDTGKGAHGSFHREGREKGKSGNKERKPSSTRGVPQGTGKNQAGSVPWEGDRANKRSVWIIPTQSFKEAHFATFPFELITDCIKAGSQEGDIVLDPFMGSGTTAIVASKLGRNFIGFELSEAYLKIATKRVASELGMFIPAPFEIETK